MLRVIWFKIGEMGRQKPTIYYTSKIYAYNSHIIHYRPLPMACAEGPCGSQTSQQTHHRRSLAVWYKDAAGLVAGRRAQSFLKEKGNVTRGDNILIVQRRFSSSVT